MERLREELEEKRAGILEEMERRATVKSRLASLQTLQTQENTRREEVERELSFVSGEQTQADDAIVSLKEEFRQVGIQVQIGILIQHHMLSLFRGAKVRSALHHSPATKNSLKSATGAAI